MIINDLLEKYHMSRYQLSIKSGVPMTTITDICSGKADVKKCSVGTIYNIAKVLNVSVDFIIENLNDESKEGRNSFETYKSNICHYVKDKGDLDFIIDTLETDEIRKLYDRQMYRESLYLLGMVDYLSRINEIPICTNYVDIRNHKLDKPIFSAGTILACEATGDESIKAQAIKNAIPEFKRFNIIECEVRDVF